MIKHMHVSAALLLSLAVTGYGETKDPAPKSSEQPAPAVKAPVKEAAAPSPLMQLKRVHTHRTYFNSRTSNSLKKSVTLPKAADVLCGKFSRLIAKDTLCCITRSKKDGPWESVIVDVNRNRDLTDDKVYALPANKTKGNLALEHKGKVHAFTASVVQSRGQVNLSLYPNECRTGKAMMGEKNVEWVACDCNLSGKLDAGDSAFLDTNGNGKLTERGRDEFLTLGPDAMMFVDSKWYAAASDESGEKLNIGPYTGKMSRLTIDHSDIAEKADAPHDLRISIAGKSTTLQGVDPLKGIELPARVMSYVSGVIKTESTPIRYSIRNFNMKEDFALMLKKPTARITVGQAKGKISVSQKIVAPSGVNYSIARAKPGPRVEVFSEEKPEEPLTKGNMAYG